tara:strand:- start:231 stop:695 length:465 start_codon:yes stop_codon:yes gene_type:complete
MKYLFTLLIAITLVTPVRAQEFEEGQAWAYKTRDHETESFIQITHIDDGPEDDRIVSISINNLKMEIINSPESYLKFLPHLPVSENMLKSNVTHQVNSVSLPTMSYVGYDTWKEQYDAGKAGWWTIDVREIVSSTEEMINQKINEMGGDFPVLK